MRAVASVLLIALAVSTAPAAATVPADRDAAVLYDRAAELIRKLSPGSTEMEWDYFRPPPKQWRDMAATAWKENQPVYALVRQARSLDHGDWSSRDTEDSDGRLNALRKL